MSDNKTILKLHFEGYSQRQIAEAVKMSRKNTISPVIQAAIAQHLTLERIVDLSEEELNSLLFPEKNFIPEYVQPDYPFPELVVPATGMGVVPVPGLGGTIRPEYSEREKVRLS